MSTVTRMLILELFKSVVKLLNILYFFIIKVKKY